MKLAIIRTGNKQYKVKEGDKIKVEKLKAEAGAKVTLDDVLLVSDGDGSNFSLGTPKTSTKVEAIVLSQGRDEKVRVVKYKNKTRYHKAYGHRQHFTELEIKKI